MILLLPALKGLNISDAEKQYIINHIDEIISYMKSIKLIDSEIALIFNRIGRQCSHQMLQNYRDNAEE